EDLFIQIYDGYFCDAMNFLKRTDEQYDIILSDLPDPSNESVARLYSTFFFKLVRSKLSRHGIFATQATSPFHTRQAFWCIYESLKASDFAEVQPYHTYVPSFGDWGFVMASNVDLPKGEFQPKVPCRYLEAGIDERLFHFEKDIANPGQLDANQLEQPALLSYFLSDWENWRKEHRN
ncbi:MAG: hypothetical protein AAFO94_17620, partial [Bacteroidota bacterium]